MNVVVAHQSPTLFNILARSKEWSLKMSPMGDHEGLREMELIDVPVWRRGRDSVPDLVLGCTPKHMDTADFMYPGVPKLWVLHNGRERNLLSADDEKRIAGALVFSEKVRWLQSGRSVPVYFVSPSYDVAPCWRWSPDVFWTMRNRPRTRVDDINAVIPAITRGFTHAFYGQEQPLGFATPAVRRRLMSHCSAYVSGLDRAAGFGLSQHECFASGVPQIGGWWGDLLEELSPEYWGLQSDLHAMAGAVRRAARDEAGAQELSRLGMEYIARCRTQERMDSTIRELIRCM